MNLQQLRYLCSACQEGSISRAAKSCCVTQQTISSAIAELESEWGIKLLIRSSTGVVPTEQGSTLLSKALRTIEDVDDLVAEAQAMRTQNERRVNFAYASLSIRSDTHPSQSDLAAFVEEHPKIRVSQFETASDACLTLVSSEMADLALVVGDPDPHIFTRKPLGNGVLCCIMADDHPLASAQTISFSQLKNYGFITPPDLNYSLKRIFSACARYDYEPMLVSSTNQETFVELLHQQGNIAIVPPGIYDPESTHSVEKHLAPEDDYSMPLWIISKKDRRQNDAAKALCSYLLACAHEA